MTRTRFHHLTVCLLCIVLVSVLFLHTVRFSWEWWLLQACGAFAWKPIINETGPFFVRLWPKRARVDLYELVGKES